MNQTSKSILLVIVLGVVIVGLGLILRHVGKSDDTSSSSVTTLSDTSSTTASSSTSASSSTISKTMDQHYTQATLKTNYGDITITLDPKMAPKTVENFLKLSSSGFYNGVKFHRVIKNFMIQGGDPLSKDDSNPSAWGTGGPGYQFDDEITATSFNVKGAVAMANSGPNTNGSQFFINVVDNTYLNGHYTVFGHVTSGYGVAQKISEVATGQGDRPVSPVVINSVELK